MPNIENDKLLSFYTKNKSLEHQKTQEFLCTLFKELEMAQEKKFASIGRIADCVIESWKLVIEIQCSPLSKKEVQNRIQDYQSIGYDCLWILHTKSFSPFKKSYLQNFLFSKRCYYTNIDRNGKGFIFDIGLQKEILAINLQEKIKTPKLPFFYLNILKKRRVFMPYHFKGDLTDLLLNKYLDHLFKMHTIALYSAIYRWMKSFAKQLEEILHFFLSKACR